MNIRFTGGPLDGEQDAPALVEPPLRIELPGGTYYRDEESIGISELGFYRAGYVWDAVLCTAESSEPGTLLCILPQGHDGQHETPRYATSEPSREESTLWTDAYPSDDGTGFAIYQAEGR